MRQDPEAHIVYYNKENPLQEIKQGLFKLPVFSWGAGNITQQGDTRKKYLQAIKAADQGNLKPLLKFARS